MSRHKLVKTMDLEDELDDFDGGNDYEYNDSAGGDGEDGEDHTCSVTFLSRVQASRINNEANVRFRIVLSAEDKGRSWSCNPSKYSSSPALRSYAEKFGHM